MKNQIFIIAIILAFIVGGCKKDDNRSINHSGNKKSAVKYLRFNGVDAECIISVTDRNFRTLIKDTLDTPVDSVMLSHSNEIRAWFPTDAATNFNDAGNVTYNYHKVGKDPNNFVYYENSDNDTFNLSSSSFVSSWNVQGGLAIGGFSDVYTNDILPSLFKLNIDTAIHKSLGYTVNLIAVPGITHADTIVYVLTDVNDPSKCIFKVTPGFTSSIPLSSNDLSTFTTGSAIRIEVIAYNFRRVVKNLNEFVYFINERVCTNEFVWIRS